MKPRGTFGDKPSEVIQVLQLARKTGLLVIERSKQDGSIEQGTISLSNGQIIDAHLGGYRGDIALELIMRWGNCYFVLHPPSSNGSSVPPSPAIAQMSPARGGSAVNNGWTKEELSPLPPVPYRLMQVDKALASMNSLGFSRAHRQLFLLIDGQRTMKELIRLMGRKPDEVLALLFDLIRAGLIHQ